MKRLILALMLPLSSAWAGPRDLLILPESEARFSRGEAEPVDAAPWWRDFDDAVLAEVIESGLAINPDVASAEARVMQARAAAWQTRAGLLPTVTADANGSAGPLNTLGFQFGAGGLAGNEGLYYIYGIGIGAQLPVDVFGRTWMSWRASRNEAQASEADRDRFRATLAATLGEAYFDVVAARQSEAVATEQHDNAVELLEVIELRYDRAGVDGLDLLQQRSQAATAESAVAQARMGRELAEQRLAVLLARAPSESVDGVAAELAMLPPAPAVGTPAELLARRADLVAAEERLDAASQRHGAAYGAVLPTVGLQADAGRDWFKTSETRAQNAWSIGGSVRVPVFNGGRGYAQIRSARAAEYGTAAAYGRLVLQAQAEVEAALAQEAAQADRLAAAERQAELARITYERSRERYLSGLDAFVNVLLADNSLRAAEQSAIAARRDLIGARIALHTALGASWASAWSE